MDESLGPQRHVIAGLGNPGKDYARTRHNVGFHIVDRLAEKHGLKFTKMMNRAIVALGNIGSEKVILVKPQTFMNDSGASIGPILKFYKTDPTRLLVIYDELDLPLAQLRMRKFGGSGGHNGMKSVIARVGTENFPRLRVGIGRPPGRMDAMDHVLEPFTKSELEMMEDAYQRAVDGIERWLRDDIERVMNIVNVGEKADKDENPRKGDATSTDSGGRNTGRAGADGKPPAA
jgi:PTH1 family peptidyl-tRNA hydrolase